MERRMRRVGSSLTRALAGACLWLAAGGSPAAALDATVTSVQGEVRAATQALTQGARVQGGSPITTAPEARGSVLVGADAVVQFCGDTSLLLREEAGSTVVAVSQGTAKTTTGPRPSDRPLEIHTPAAVAVIHGTEVSTTVDPATGATTFAVDEGVVEIRPRGGAAPVTLRAGESLSVPAFGPPGAVDRIRPDRLADRLGCLETSLFQVAALHSAREERKAKALDTLVDQEFSDLPSVAAAPPFTEPPEPDDIYDPIVDPTPLDPEFVPKNEPVEPPPVVEPPEPSLPPCMGPPGDHCQF